MLIKFHSFWISFFSFFAFVILAQAQVWTQTSAPTNFWTGIAMSSDASKLFACAGDTTGSKGSPIYISTDSGLTWTKSSSPTNLWASIACSADGNKIITVSKQGGIALSSNGGSTWVSNNFPGIFWKSVASSSDGSRLFMLSLFGQYYRSTNFGASWISAPSPGGNASIACSSTGQKLVAAAGSSSPRAVCTSLDFGVTWATNSSANWTNGPVAFSIDGGKLWIGDFAANPNGMIRRSLDFANTWNTNNSPNGAWISIDPSADGTNIIAAAWQTAGNPSGSIYTSANGGNTWISNNIPTEGWRSVACSPDGRMFIAVSDRSSSSPNDAGKGHIWIAQTSLTPRLRLVASESSLHLSWTVPSTNYILQQNSIIGSPGWINIATSPSFNLTNLENTVILPLPTDAAFFRLSPP